MNDSSVNVLRLTIEPTEGINSEPSFIITPTGSETYSQVVTIPIKPLSSHEKASHMPEGLCLNKMKIKGSFDVNQMNNWLYNILPDVSVNIVDRVGECDAGNIIYLLFSPHSNLSIDRSD